MFFKIALPIFLFAFSSCYGKKGLQGCPDVELEKDLKVSVCWSAGTQLSVAKPLTVLNLSNFTYSYNYLTGRHYASFKFNYRATNTVDIIKSMTVYTNASAANVTFAKATHARFVQKYTDFYDIVEYIKMFKDWTKVDDEGFFYLKFSCLSKEVAYKIYEEAKSTDRKPGQIIQELLDVELKVVSGRNKATIKTPIRATQSGRVEVKNEEIFTSGGSIDIFDGSKKNYSIEWRRVFLAGGYYRQGLTIGKLPFIAEKRWILLHRRENYDYSFNKSLRHYDKGFGDPRNNFWLGLQNLKKIVASTDSRTSTLRMEFERQNGEQNVAVYRNTEILEKNFAPKYLWLGNYVFDKSSSTVDKDPMPKGRETVFSAYDDSYELGISRCAVKDGGGWWFTFDCSKVNFNSACMYWFDKAECLKRARMYLIVE